MDEGLQTTGAASGVATGAVTTTGSRGLFAVLRQLGTHLVAIVGAGFMTLTLFLVLPLIQAISQPPKSDMVTTQVDSANVPPPPPPPEEEEEEEEPEEEPEPPQMQDEAMPLDLSQLELAMNAGIGEGFAGAGDFAIDLNVFGGGAGAVDSLFSMGDLDQKPRAIYQPGPIIDAKLRKKTPGTVKVVFDVNERGRVENPTVLSSTDSAFDRAALAAVKKWKFEPGKRNGQPVSFRMRIPITFPKS